MASKDGRLYAKFTHDFADSPKIAPLSDQAFRTLVEMTLWSARMATDGHIPEGVAVRFWQPLALASLCQNDATNPSLTRTDDGGYQIHDFTKHQTTKADIEAKREAGRLGGLAKAAKVIAPATNLLEQTASKVVANTEDRSKKDKEPSSAPAVRVTESDFENAYSHWPKKTERKKSFEKFRKVAAERGLDVITADVIRYGDAYTRSTEKQFVPALVVWLNGERWDDELPGSSTTRPYVTHKPAPNGQRYAVDVAMEEFLPPRREVS